MDPFTIIFLVALTISTVIYLCDRSGWHATGKRLTNIVRASIESAKTVKALEEKTKAIQQRDKDQWTAEFQGKQLETGPKHEIVKTWFAKFDGDVRPHWKCKCGISDWHMDVPAATRKSEQHVTEQNYAEELLTRNGGTRAW